MEKQEKQRVNLGDSEAYEYIIAMGISTGGPKLLSEIISELDDNLSATYIIVQHMPQGFTHSLANRLNTLTKLNVSEAVDGEYLKRGCIYIAPAGYQLKIVNGIRPRIEIVNEEPYQGHKPSVNVMMSSIAKLNHLEKSIIAVIMTGMGRDGLEGVTELKQLKPCKLIAQDSNSSTIFGMPKAVIDSGLADFIVSGEYIAKKIKEIVEGNYGR